METQSIQQQLIQEMKDQGAKLITMKGIISRLKTEKQQKEMLDYLIKTKDIPIPAGRIIMKSIQISEKK